jgi:hypothetical protein
VSCAPLLIAALLHASPAVSDREVAERAVREFEEGVRLRSAADQAHLLADDLPHAILSYRRGLRLAPNDLALRQSLTATRERVVYPASGGLGRPRNDPRPPWLPHPRTEWLGLVAGVCYVPGWVFLTRWLMLRRGRLLSAGLFALLLAGLLSAWLVLRKREERKQDEHPLVVIAKDGVLLRRGNGTTFPPRYDTPVNGGVEARRMFERRGWVQIELSGGEIGWVPRDAVLVDSP